jgi:hypothetical protein
MGTMRLLVDARESSPPEGVGIDRLGELLRDRNNRLWLDISDPDPGDPRGAAC